MSETMHDIAMQRRGEALEVLRRNDRGEYSVPTHGLYPMQFNWDSAFSALGYGYLDLARAWRELEILTEAQWPDGMIPHVMFRGGHDSYFPGPAVWQAGTTLPTSGITQPPYLATAFRRLHVRHGPIERDRGQAMLGRVLRWHQWFLAARRDEGSGTIIATHPWESGRDNLVDWDAAMDRVEVSVTEPYKRRDLDHVDAAERPTKDQYDRYLSIVAHGVSQGWDQAVFGRTSPFRMADPGMTAILLRAHRDLIALLPAYGLDDQMGAATALLPAMERGLEGLWNSQIGAYTAFDPVERRHVGGVSSAAFLGPYAGVCDPDRIVPLQAHFDRIAARSRFMVPSYDPESAHFDAKRYWRGPVWLIVNNMIATGFADIGDHERAARIRQDSRELVERAGFREYYDPITGEGLGGGAFSWTAAMYLDWVLEGAGD